MKHILFLLPLLLLSACNPCARLSRLCPPVEAAKDSVWSHDTVFFERVVVDTQAVVRLIPQYVEVERDIEGVAEASTFYTLGRAWVEDGKIRLSLANRDSALALVSQIRELQYQLSEKGRVTASTKTVTVYRTRGFVKFLAWSGGVFLLILLGIVVWKVVKVFRPSV